MFVWSLLLVIDLYPTAVIAQTAAPAARVSWPLVDFLVFADSQQVQLLVSPNMRSDQETSGGDITLVFAAPRLREWMALVAQTVDSVERLRSEERAPFRPIATITNAGRGLVGVSLDARADRRAPYRLAMITAGAPRRGWAVYASAEELRRIFAVLRTTADSPNYRRFPGVAFLSCDLEQPAQVLREGRLDYPRRELDNERDGRVLAEFVVDSSGTAVPESFRALLTDGDGFTEEVRRAVARTRFAPGRAEGRPVPSVVWRWVRFRIAR